ncbi:hypothetical protein H6P81_020091 [Aristolochia fimbriata]|uniref:40S ribosomal protein S16 n=1 Tax=Aristolochia fimbriata TaxID=158543 RepID=A0AAV7DUP3_ARIFI|nr:hypothetical protein H6P81_020091 [Aristolochia fimbriata]
MAAAVESVQCFGRKKTAVAVTHCKRGRGLIKINGCPIELVEPEILRYKAYEPILLLGRHRFSGVDMRIRVRGGGHTSQIYAIRQSIAKALVAYYQKYVDEQSKKEIKDILGRYDRTLLVADPRRCEPKKFGGRAVKTISPIYLFGYVKFDGNFYLVCLFEGSSCTESLLVADDWSYLEAYSKESMMETSRFLSVSVNCKRAIFSAAVSSCSS